MARSSRARPPHAIPRRPPVCSPQVSAIEPIGPERPTRSVDAYGPARAI
jgi:hypothetical protein